MNCLRFSNFKSIKKKNVHLKGSNQDLLTTRLVDILNESIIFSINNEDLNYHHLDYKMVDQTIAKLLVEKHPKCTPHIFSKRI